MKAREDLDQAAYLRGWNDRASIDMWVGIAVGAIVSTFVAMMIWYVCITLQTPPTVYPVAS